MREGQDTSSRAWYLLLLLPIVGLLWVPIYAKETPELFGFPFFYWYQFAWVPVSVLITFFVYTRTRTRGTPSPRPPVSESQPPAPPTDPGTKPPSS